MFDESIWVAKGRTRRAWTVPASFAGQALVVGLLVLVPLVFTERLTLSRLAVPAPLRYGVRKPVSEHTVKLVSTGRAPRRAAPFVAPSSIPRGVARVVEAPQLASAADAEPECTGLCIAGDPNGLPDGVLLPASPAAALPPAPPVKRAEPKPASRAAAEPVRIKVGTGVQEARLLERVKPVYPRLAITTRTSGDVELEAIIGTDGRIREISVIGGHPMLVPAALEAVRQWAYRPTPLNGEPVEVITRITVRFILGQS